MTKQDRLLEIKKEKIARWENHEWLMKELELAWRVNAEVMGHLNNGSISANEALCLIRRDVEDALEKGMK